MYRSREERPGSETIRFLINDTFVANKTNMIRLLRMNGMRTWIAEHEPLKAHMQNYILDNIVPTIMIFYTDNHISLKLTPQNRFYISYKSDNSLYHKILMKQLIHEKVSET